MMNSTSWEPPDPAAAAFGGAPPQLPPYRNLAAHVPSGNINQQLSPVDFYRQCLSLARCIDIALANGEVPAIAKDLPALMKQLYRGKNDFLTQAALMVLIIYVKNACKMGWFQPNEAEELFSIADEIEKIYCNMGNINSEPNSCHYAISTVMERFYPTMNLGQTLVSVEAKPGYGAYTVDFQITKSTAPENKIWLLVAQTDNIETSACLISPPQVSFLLNGNAVSGRTNVFMDSGPQMPTNVTSMVKFGTNLLQAVGQFNGHYVILVAHMSFRSLPDHPVLQDYVQPAVTSVDTDIIEGPSQISLNCPLSFSRIKTPVKGHSCKHFQCFDFDNFIDMNSRFPSWRCPHCNQYVSYADIRLDQNMAEILKDVGENIVEVIVLADGSWKAVLESDHNVDKMQNKAYNFEKETCDPRDSICSPNAVSNVLDLTIDDYHIDIMDTLETADMKPLPASVDTQFVTPNSTSLGMTSTSVDQNVAPHLEDDFWSGLDLAFGRSDTPTVGVSEQHVLPDTVSPHVSLSNTATADGSIAILSDTERQQHFSRSPMNLPQVSGVNSSSLLHHSAPQNQAPPINNNSAPSPLPTPNRPYRSLSELTNPHLQQVLNSRAHPTTHLQQVPNSRAHPTTRVQSDIQQGGSNVQSSGATANSKQSRVNTPSLIRRQSAPVSGTPLTGDSLCGLAGDQRGNVGGSQSISGTNNLHNSQSDPNWRPNVRMRGSLSGRQFSDDIRQLMIVPTQMVQDSRPPYPQPVQGSRPHGQPPVQGSGLLGPRPSRPTGFSSLNVLIANNRNALNHSRNA